LSKFQQRQRYKDPDKGMELVLEYLRWISVIKPKYWIMENVSSVEKYLKWRIVDFKIPVIKVLNSANFGVPQVRKRMFAGNYKIPKQTHSKLGGIDLFGEKIAKWKTVIDAIGDIMFLEPNQRFDSLLITDQISVENAKASFVWATLVKLKENKKLKIENGEWKLYNA